MLISDLLLLLFISLYSSPCISTNTRLFPTIHNLLDLPRSSCSVEPSLAAIQQLYADSFVALVLRSILTSYHSLLTSSAHIFASTPPIQTFLPPLDSITRALSVGSFCATFAFHSAAVCVILSLYYFYPSSTFTSSYLPQFLLVFPLCFTIPFYYPTPFYRHLFRLSSTSFAASIIVLICHILPISPYLLDPVCLLFPSLNSPRNHVVLDSLEPPRSHLPDRRICTPIGHLLVSQWPTLCPLCWQCCHCLPRSLICSCTSAE